MAETFTKLFSSIIDSSVWAESHTTVRVWVTLLAKCDRKGRVFAAVPGLAHAARVTLAECEIALNTFMSPDRYSRTPDHEGRRIEEIAGGWLLLNHAHYRELRNEEDRREYQADWARKKAASEREASIRVEPDAKLSNSTNLDKPRPESTNADADADAETDAGKANALSDPEPPPELPRGNYTEAFCAFWDAYPGANKGSKKNAFTKWKARGLDKHVQALIDDVKRRGLEHWMWVKDSGQFIPMVATYINGSLWEADIVAANGTTSPGRNRAATEQHNTEAAQRFADEDENE